MGRRGSSRRGGRGGGFNRNRKGNNGASNGGDSYHRSYSEIRKEHEKLEHLYNMLLPFNDAEKTEFWATLRRELPNSFRFCGSKGHALAVKRLLETRYAPEIVKIERFDGQLVEPPKIVPWYPDQLAYSMTTPKQVVRKFPPFAAFQKFLVSETSIGNISRQEVVSMIPPLLMDVLPGMTVLDLCAAPGSKAAQLLEMIHTGEEARIRKVMSCFGEIKAEVEAEAKKEEDGVNLEVDAGDDGRATGLLIANDVDYKRSHMLTHQLKRLASPNLLVTNHDATLFPSIRLPKASASSKDSNFLRFDRILADVPCSGDGTLRKNVAMWKDWQPGSALGLHATQIRILVRALTMLKPNGRVVYSTCSMNPIENESVIVSAIERCGGPSKVEIIDCSDRLPGLQRRPGMHQWQIMDKSGRIWSSWDEVQQFVLTENDGVVPGRLSESMFRRPDDSECSGLPLDRCMRVYPHQQDTGGFFITVLEKKGDFKTKPETSQSNAAIPITGNGKEERKEEIAAKIAHEEEKAAHGEPTDILPTSGGVKRPLGDGETRGPPKPKQMKMETEADLKRGKETDVKEEVADTSSTTRNTPNPNPKSKREVHTRKNPDGSFEEPFKYLSPDHEVIQKIQDFYKISSRFPRDRYMVRNALGEPAKAVYYTSALVRDILRENEGRGVKFIHGGVRMFMKQESPSAEVCRWRIQAEGISMIQGYIGDERVVRLTNKETFRKLLKEMFPRFADEDWAKLGEIGERIRDIGMGCCVLRVEPDGSDPEWTEHMVLPLWKSFMSVNLMLPKEDRAALLLRLFNDTSPLVNESLKSKAAKTAKSDEEVVKQDADEEGTQEHVQYGEGKDGDAVAEAEEVLNGDGADHVMIETAEGDDVLDVVDG